VLRLGLLLAGCVLIADQATKVMVLAWLEQPVAVTPFLNLVLVWNRGVSFGMLSSLGAGVSWVLSGLALAVVVGLLIWLKRSTHPLTASGLGLVIGGALGNVIDRIRFGAVVDFVDVHVAGWHWPAFNVADAAICIGAAALLADSLLVPRRRPT